MTSIGDIVRITSCKTMFTEQVCNVFYFAVAAWTGVVPIEDVLQLFLESEHTAFSNVLSGAVVWDKATWDNLTDPLEKAEYVPPITLQGGGIGAALPSFVALGFVLDRSDLSTRNGAKRYAGLTEPEVTDQNVSIGGGDIGAMQSFLASSFSIDSDASIDPVIVGRDSLGQPDLGRINPVIAARMSTLVTSQITRKANRGS